MATEAILQTLSGTAAADYRTKQFYAVTFTSDGNITLAATGKECDGFLQDKPNINQAGSVAIFGVTKAAISDTISIGQLLEVDSGGTLKGSSAGTVVAKALEAGATGNIISVLIQKSNAVYA